MFKVLIQYNFKLILGHHLQNVEIKKEEVTDLIKVRAQLSRVTICRSHDV